MLAVPGRVGQEEGDGLELSLRDDDDELLVSLDVEVEVGLLDVLDDEVLLLLVGGVVGVVGSDGVGDAVLVGDGGSLRGGEVVVPGGSVVPGGMTVPGGSGVPGGSTIGASSEPSGGSSVTTCVPSGLVVTTAVREPAGSATPSTVTGAWPGAASPGISCAPDVDWPFGTAAFGESPGAMKVARPPNAVASTTPLTASST
ncbi:hypothetical protein HNR02_000269 [Amycolatopsis endophytica]|uniref:Uncharacterized protein n=1 Tax=Amycolatopsis endophytica TaxID=860233 RepID=A0A853AWF8_9PSEU|nr:hypothetical protein [Amycolatopsis endophytica]NYI86946.1 hypothetical protein [Amycolatopsis endophytica]